MILLIGLSIDRIEFHGNRFLKDGYLRELFGYNRTILWFGRYPEYSPFLIRRSISTIEQVYKDSGFFDVNIHWKDSVFNGKVRISVRINEGERYRITKVIFSKSVPLNVKLPRYFSETYLSELENSILDYFQNDGYPFVEIQREIRPDYENKSVEVIFNINEKERIRIRNIILRSQDTTKDLKTRRKIFEREVVLKGGDYFSKNKLEESISRLYRTQLFSGIYWRLENIEDGYADLVIYIKEGAPRILDISVGFQNEARYPLLLRFDNIFQHVNLFNNLQRIQLSTNFLVDISKLSFVSYGARIVYQEPYFLDLNLRANINVPVYYDRDKGLFQYGFNGEIVRPYFFGKGNDLTFGTAFENRRSIYDEGIYKIFRVYQGFNLDFRDDIFDPNWGSLLRFSLNETGLGYFGDYDFVKGISDMSFYQRFFLSSWKWALRVYIGGILPYGRSDSLPVIDLFTLGGEGQIRGYDRFSIGPDLSRCYGLICKAGKQIFIINYEIRRRFYKDWGFVILFDYGRLDGFSAYSTGFGIRYFTPIGPVRFDWAIKLKDRSKTDRGRIYISLGHMF